MQVESRIPASSPRQCEIKTVASLNGATHLRSKIWNGMKITEVLQLAVCNL